MANAIILDDVNFARGETQILRGASFVVEEGEVFGLIGRSGCGKSTALRLISGLCRPDRGTVEVLGRLAHEYESGDRCVATVWQNRALFPHLSVKGNLEFGLKVHKVKRHDRKKRIDEAIKNFHLEHLLNRSVDALSGGEQQRLALARAILIRPRVLLLDEPFTGLDQELRFELQADLRELLRMYRCTYILVSHIQEDVLSLSTKVAVLDGGKIIQQGTPIELYTRPSTAFVARFVGGKNVIPATVRAYDSASSSAQVEVGPNDPLWPARALSGVLPNDEVYYVIGPEHVRLDSTGICRASGSLRAREQNGAFEILYVRLESGAEIRISRFLGDGGARSVVRGEVLVMSWDPSEAFVLPIGDSGQRRKSAAAP